LVYLQYKFCFGTTEAKHLHNVIQKALQDHYSLNL
jgi:hypothetical protein